MKLFIPTIGTKLKLTKPWKFRLYYENRNTAYMANVAGIKIPTKEDGPWAAWDYVWKKAKKDESERFQLPKGVILKVDRIYIRQQKGEYDSISFRCADSGFKGRFWAKLADVNNIHCTVVEE